MEEVFAISSDQLAQSERPDRVARYPRAERLKFKSRIINHPSRVAYESHILVEFTACAFAIVCVAN